MSTHDAITRAIAANGTIQFITISARDTVGQARAMHKLSPTSCAALGRALCAAAMLGNEIKAAEGSITINIKGDGPIGRVVAAAGPDGCPRGYVGNPACDPPRKPDGKLDVAAAVGAGQLTVLKDLGMREPYIGQSQLVSGEIAEDIAQYMLVSEQSPGACALGVLVGGQAEVLAAGGYIIRALPGADDSILSQLEQLVYLLPPVTELLSDGADSEDLARMLMVGLEGEILTTTHIEYRCKCSQERVERAIISLGREELSKMGGSAEVNCEFCDKIYSIAVDKLLESIKA